MADPIASTSSFVTAQTGLLAAETFLLGIWVARADRLLTEVRGHVYRADFLLTENPSAADLYESTKAIQSVRDITVAAAIIDPHDGRTCGSRVWLTRIAGCLLALTYFLLWLDSSPSPSFSNWEFVRNPTVAPTVFLFVLTVSLGVAGLLLVYRNDQDLRKLTKKADELTKKADKFREDAKLVIKPPGAG